MGSPREMKYVMLCGDIPILFPLQLNHADVSARFGVARAGLCRISVLQNDTVVECYGRSQSLNVESCGEDAKIIRQMLEKPE